MGLEMPINCQYRTFLHLLHIYQMNKKSSDDGRAARKGTEERGKQRRMRMF